MEPTALAETESRGERFLRRLRWIFSKSGVLPLAFEHFLAMIPATILVPVLVNNSFGTTVIDISLVLFTSGLGTLLFLLLSRGAIPAYLGSSFAYIGLTVYLIEQRTSEGVSHAMAFSYVGWAYIFSGLLLFLLSILYRKRGIERVLSFLLPATVVGPAISLIGLELSDTAAADAGFDVVEGLVDGRAAIVALVTLVVIVVFSLTRHRVLKNAAIIVGMLVGCLVSFLFYGFPTEAFSDVRFFTVPRFHLPLLVFPPNLPGLLVAVIPATVIVFTENIGRITVISRMTGPEREERTPEVESNPHAEMIDDDTGEGDLFTKQSVKKMRSSLFSHGLSSLVAGACGSVPNTIYAENIAVMSIHATDIKREDPDPFIKKLVDPVSVWPYVIAALIAILFSFVGVLQTALLAIPKAVIGGMELFLFGIISAPGIQLLVEQRVNYKKVSNQIVTAAVLLSGISGISVNLGFVELKGMSLGFLIGVVLNLFVQLLRWLGSISDTMSFEELLVEGLSAFGSGTPYRVMGYRKEGEEEIDRSKDLSLAGLAYALRGRDCRLRLPSGQWVSDDTLRDDIGHADLLSVGLGRSAAEPVVRFRKTANGLFVDVLTEKIPEEVRRAYLNDYDTIDEDGPWLFINATDNIPMRRIRSLLRIIDTTEKG